MNLYLFYHRYLDADCLILLIFKTFTLDIAIYVVV
nr:MAG TPA: hypothetical protein [Caudoviricetes sp.]